MLANFEILTSDLETRPKFRVLTIQSLRGPECSLRRYQRLKNEISTSYNRKIFHTLKNFYNRGSTCRNICSYPDTTYQDRDMPSPGGGRGRSSLDGAQSDSVKFFLKNRCW